MMTSHQSITLQQAPTVPATEPIACLGLVLDPHQITASLLLSPGDQHTEWVVPNAHVGVVLLLAQVKEVLARHTTTSVRIGMQDGAVAWWEHVQCVRATLSVRDTLPAIYLLPTADVGSDTGGGSTRDHAAGVAQRLRDGPLPPIFEPEHLLLPLQRLLRLRMILAQGLSREQQALGQLLPATEEHVGLENNGTEDNGSGRHLALIGLDAGRLEDNETEDSGAVMHVPDATALFSRDMLGIPPTVDVASIALNEPFGQELGTMLVTIKLLTRQVQEMDHAIVATLASLPMRSHPLATIPGLAPHWIAGLWAEIGNIARFADADALLRYAGLKGKPRHSQALTSELPPTMAYNPFLQAYLLEAAKTLRTENVEFHQIYERAMLRGLRHQQAIEQVAKQAVRHVERRLRREIRL